MLFSVTIPPGVQPGQVLTVLAVDGTRRVKATVPAGLQSGDTFLVRLATPINPQVLNSKPLQPPEQRTQPEETPRPESPEPNFASALDAWLTPSPDPPNLSSNKQSPEPSGSYHNTLGNGNNYHHQQSFQQYQNVNHPYTHQSQVLPNPILPPVSPQQVPGQSISATVESPTSSTDRLHQKLLLVQVPPGMPPGSSLQVEIPGENRTLTAQVPPGGVQSFHVAYSPRPQQQSSLVGDDKNKSKLLLVRVPPGTAPGTTLHVSIPDEPGRILAAQVPAGNVPEFHVSYEPRSQKNGGYRS